MRYIVKQFRYAGEGNSNNFPQGLSKETLISPSGLQSLTEEMHPFYALGITGMPGTIFFLEDINNNNFNKNENIIPYNGYISFGYYDLQPTNILFFDEESINNLVEHGKSLIIDIVYAIREEGDFVNEYTFL